jgi:hypothetical protein
MIILQLSFHSVAVVLTPVQTKQIGINIHKRNNKKHSKYKYTCYQNTHTLQHFKPPQHKIHIEWNSHNTTRWNVTRKPHNIKDCAYANGFPVLAEDTLVVIINTSARDNNMGQVGQKVMWGAGMGGVDRPLWLRIRTSVELPWTR